MRGESVRPGKRPIRALSASEKMDAIQRVHEGESKASVARDIGVPESTLRGWCKSEHKIRGMARNSSTPDSSEAHSPASSSGTTNMATAGVISNAANLSSEDEGPTSKRSRMNHQVPATTSYGTINENAENEIKMDDKSKIDYVSLMTSMAAAGMRTDNSSLLLQQLGLLSGATGTLTKNLLNVPSSLAHSSAVGLVENGLQYTKSSGNNNNNNKRHSISAIAPNQMDSVAKSCSRKSLPAAAEAPCTPAIPASPRKTNENNMQHVGKGKKDSGSNKKVDEALWHWLTQQQQLLGQQSAPFNLSANQQQDGSWFWQWYKQCNFPLAAAAAAAAASTPLTSTLPIAKKSPSKIRALLDNALCNNNNENVKHGLMPMDADETDSDVPGSMEEAIEHGEKFFKWLDNCSDPAVTRLQTLQFKFLLDNLKTCRKKPNRKHSRK